MDTESEIQTKNTQARSRFDEETFNLSKKGCKQTILVADDAADIRMIVSGALEFDGFDCMQAADGKEALELATIYQPGLIILDLMLPHLNGFQVLQKLKNAQPETKVCVLSSIDKPDVIKKAFDFGADEYLVKPILPDVLSYKVQSILSQDEPPRFFAANSDLPAKLILDESRFDCRITSVSEVGISIVAEKMPVQSDRLVTLQCRELEEIFDDSVAIYVKKSRANYSLWGSAQFEFVALSLSRLEKLRTVVLNGRYLSKATQYTWPMGRRGH